MLDELLLASSEPAGSKKFAPAPVAAYFGHLVVASVN
jgi:hypothetical protein